MKDDQTLCPVCAEGHLSPHIRSQEMEYLGRTFTVDGLAFSICDNCEAHTVTPEHSRANKRRVLAARKTALGLLHGEEIRAMREKYDLTQQHAAAIFGGGPNAFSKYENDEVVQSESMDKLLRLAQESNWVVYRLCNMAGVEWNRERTQAMGSHVFVSSWFSTEFEAALKELHATLRASHLTFNVQKSSSIRKKRKQDAHKSIKGAPRFVSVAQKNVVIVNDEEFGAPEPIAA